MVPVGDEGTVVVDGGGAVAEFVDEHFNKVKQPYQKMLKDKKRPNSAIQLRQVNVRFGG